MTVLKGMFEAALLRHGIGRSLRQVCPVSVSQQVCSIMDTGGMLA